MSASQGHGATAYVGFEGLRLGPGPAGLYNGVARTNDGGRTWQVVHRESNQPSPTMTGSWLEERAVMPGPDIWFDAPYDLGVSPRDADLLYVTDLFRTYRTLDGGGHWAQVHSKPVGPGRWTTRGLDVTTAYGVHVDPHDPARVFISYTDIGLFRSEDGGRSWMVSSQGMPQDWRNTAYWVAFDPDRAGVMWGAFSGTARSAAAEDVAQRAIRRATAAASGCHATAAGRGRRRTGLPAAAVTHVLVDPQSPAASRTVYACLFGRGVFKSRDGGVTWTREERRACGTAAVCVAHHALAERQAVPGRCATQRERPASATRAMARSTSPTMAPSTGRRSRCRPAPTARPAC